MQTVIGAFDDRAVAQRAVDRLVDAGCDPGDIHIEQDTASTGPATSAMNDSTASRPTEPRESREGISGFFATLFGGAEQAPMQETYTEAVRRGTAVVVVDVVDDSQADQVAAILHEMGAIDVDERARQWQAGGSMANQEVGSADTARATPAQTGQEGVLDVVQEELRVGKRAMDRGGVRVIQRVTERPVREIVRLREERATVERRPVDRPATEQDLANFKEGSLEVREMNEEAVVSKSARVVEEVRVGKEVREREETIEDSVRRKDVEVERIAGEGRESLSERERAVAADNTDPTLDPANQAGRDSDSTLRRKPKAGDKDKPTR